MNRRRLLQSAAATMLAPGLWPKAFSPTRAFAAALPASRVRPGDPSWPSPARWAQLGRDVGGQLFKVEPPFAACMQAPSSSACADVFKALKNPYYLGDEAGLDPDTRMGRCLDLAAERLCGRRADDEGCRRGGQFRARNNLRVVVKGGGHSYQGTSNAADSLLIWTRMMNDITLHDAFVGEGCAGSAEPQPAVTVEAGAIWGTGLQRRHD